MHLFLFPHLISFKELVGSKWGQEPIAKTFTKGTYHAVYITSWKLLFIYHSHYFTTCILAHVTLNRNYFTNEFKKLKQKS